MNIMNKQITLVFSSYQSHDLLKKAIIKLPKKYKIIIIENSQDKSLKNYLEKKFKNVQVIIPKNNLGLARSYNLGLKKAKTKYVFLNNPDNSFQEETIIKLYKCANHIKKFAIISPTYKNENIYKNYEIYKPQKKNKRPKILNKYDVVEADIIDNCFFVNKKEIKNNYFDENYFLYFETFDFCKNLKKKGKKLFVCKNIKYHHKGSASVSKKFEKVVKLTRAFHYNWSKFYYFKKNYNFFKALKKIFPNLFRSLKKILISIISFDKESVMIGIIEFFGIISSILNFKSFYRPKV